MIQRRRRRRSTPLLLIVGLVPAVAGCARVTPEELDSRLQQIRQEMEEGDRENARRVDGLEGRIRDVGSRVDALERDLQALEREFNATVERLETALRFSVPVHFAFDSATVRPQDQEVLDRFSRIARQHYPEALITVEGFTDAAGSAAYNRRLGMRRAEAVKAYLVERGGLPSQQIRTVSYGEDEERLIAKGAQGPGEAGIENRRVVLVIDHGSAGARPDTSGGSGRDGS